MALPTTTQVVTYRKLPEASPRLASRLFLAQHTELLQIINKHNILNVSVEKKL